MEDKFKDIMEQLNHEKEKLPKESSQAKLAVLMGIEKATQEHVKYKRFQLFNLRICFGIVSCVLLFVVGLNTNVAMYQVMAKMPIIGNVADVFTFNRYSDQRSDTVSALVDTPSIANISEDNDQSNRMIEEYSNSLIRQYEADVSNMVGEGTYELFSNYEVVFENNAFVCIRIYTSIVMASSQQFVKTFTIDKESGDVLALIEFLNDDVLLLNKISENIKFQMRNQMENDENITYWIDDETLGDYSFIGLNGGENYYLIDDNTIVVEFDKYEVAPGSMGIVSFEVNLNNL